MNGGCFGAICATNVPPARNRGNPMKKERTERNLPFPNMESRNRIRPAAKERGFRSEQAFILAACENELERGDNNEATTQLLDARIAATLSNLSKEVQSLFTLVHTQVALTEGGIRVRKNPKRRGVVIEPDPKLRSCNDVVIRPSPLRLAAAFNGKPISRLTTL